MNSIQKKIIKIASDLADEMIKSFEMTESEWKKYSEQHPNAKKENHTVTPDSQEKSKGVTKGMDDYLMRTEPLYCAMHPLTREDQLDELSNSDDRFIRSAVARNPSTHPKTLEKLSNDEEWSVRGSVAGNPNAHPKTLEKLSEDKEFPVRMSLLINKKAPNKIKRKIENNMSKKEKSHTQYLRWKNHFTGIG